MVKVRSVSALVSVDTVIDSLKIQGIAFRGPLLTPGKRVIFLVDGYIFLQSELLDLQQQDKLNPEGIREAAKGTQAPYQ